MTEDDKRDNCDFNSAAYFAGIAVGTCSWFVPYFTRRGAFCFMLAAALLAIWHFCKPVYRLYQSGKE